MEKHEIQILNHTDNFLIVRADHDDTQAIVSFLLFEININFNVIMYAEVSDTTIHFYDDIQNDSIFAEMINTNFAVCIPSKK